MKKLYSETMDSINTSSKKVMYLFNLYDRFITFLKKNAFLTCHISS